MSSTTLPVTRCANCEVPVALNEGLQLLHAGELIGAVCPLCLADVRKPRVTLMRQTREGSLSIEQYTCVEVFR